MGAATHLGIDLADYDRSIRSFIPGYETMLDVAAAALPKKPRLIVDLGIGTGALAARCVAHAPLARIVGIDVDPGMMTMAARRLGNRATFMNRSFLRADLPRCDAIVASLALHHIRTRASKRALYARMKRALNRGGRAIVVDCLPAAEGELARAQHAAWRRHMERTYTARETRGYFKAWAREDVYLPLESELALMGAGGFRAEVIWRAGAFAVLVGL